VHSLVGKIVTQVVKIHPPAVAI
jgi:hypothetical protein